MDVHGRRAVTAALRLRSIDVLTAQEDGSAELTDDALLKTGDGTRSHPRLAGRGPPPRGSKMVGRAQGFLWHHLRASVAYYDRPDGGRP